MQIVLHKSLPPLPDALNDTARYVQSLRLQMSTESLAHKPSLKYNSESCAQVPSTPPTPPRPQSAMELCAKAALYWWKSGGACSALHRCCKSADVCALDARCKQPKHTRRVNSTKQTSSPGMCTSFTNFHQLRWLMTA